MEKDDDALEWTRKALALAQITRSKELLKDVYFTLSELERLHGNYTAAFDHFKTHVRYADSITNEENTREIVQTQMQHEFEKEEARARSLQQTRDAIAEKEKRKQSIIRNVFMAGFVLVLIFGVLIFKEYRNKKKANEIILAQKLEVERSRAVITSQKTIVEEKQKEILDSIYYASRIQRSLLTPDKYIHKSLKRLTDLTGNDKN
jgi:hypothetical protein